MIQFIIDNNTSISTRTCFPTKTFLSPTTLRRAIFPTFTILIKTAFRDIISAILVLYTTLSNTAFRNVCTTIFAALTVLSCTAYWMSVPIMISLIPFIPFIPFTLSIIFYSILTYFIYITISDSKMII